MEAVFGTAPFLLTRKVPELRAGFLDTARWLLALFRFTATAPPPAAGCLAPPLAGCLSSLKQCHRAAEFGVSQAHSHWRVEALGLAEELFTAANVVSHSLTRTSFHRVCVIVSKREKDRRWCNQPNSISFVSRKSSSFTKG